MSSCDDMVSPCFSLPFENQEMLRVVKLSPSIVVCKNAKSVEVVYNPVGWLVGSE